MLTHLNTVSSVTIGDRLSRHIQRPASHPAHPGSSSSKATRSHANTGFAEKSHTHATALLLSGAPPHVVMRRLGHADIQTTLSTYGWVTEDAEMRTLAQWRSYVAGWKGLHHDHTD